MPQISIRLDETVKKQADALLEDLGLNMTTAFNLFLRQMIRHRGIPFEITADPFYSPENMRVLDASIRDAEAGKVAVHDLIEC